MILNVVKRQAKDVIDIFLVGYVEERLWWPIQRPNIRRKKKANS